MPMNSAALDPHHIPPPPRAARDRTDDWPRPAGAGFGLRITVVGLGPLQEACLAGMLALALSWGSAELLFRLGAPEPAVRPILSASVQG
jgi:hypothetical protein